MSPESLDALATRLLRDHPHPGALYGIGVGPGDPGLLTLRGAALLQRLDVVAAPRSERGSGIARTVVADLVEPERLLELPSAMPRESEEILDGWRARVAPLLAALHEGASVGFVTDGDPLLYSTFVYAAQAVLQQRASTVVHVVAGVSAMNGAAAAARAPLAFGAERLMVLPLARVDDSALRAAVETSDVLVLLKAGGHLDRVNALSASLDPPWSVQYVRRVGLDGEEVRDRLGDATDPDDYMSLVIMRRRPVAALEVMTLLGGADAR
ncbi:MAG TPA: precorrin-2 C(20)-methyltransferase [Candidatus Dormibacteraeota bacterium]|nr:precorrin-2 C(20)-methyltransferase [Candidatus Dormibacteraeota bacterium]